MILRLIGHVVGELADRVLNLLYPLEVHCKTYLCDLKDGPERLAQHEEDCEVCEPDELS